MAQFGRPVSTVSAGTWVAAGGPTALWDALNETSASDTDYIQSTNNPTNDTCEVALGSILDPVSSTGHVIHYRYAKSAAAGRSIALTVSLRQGATEVASWTHSAISDVAATASQTLTAGQADAISNYADLRLRVVATVSGSGGGRAGRVTWAEAETPDAPVVAVAAERTLQWSVSSLSNPQPRFRLRAAVGGSTVRGGATLRASQTQAAGKPLDTRWSVAAVVADQLDLRWTVGAAIAKSLDTRWTASALAAKPLDTRWSVAAVVADQLDLRWTVGAAIAKSLDTRWTASALAAKPLDTRWSAAAAVADTLDLRWTVSTAAVKPLDLRWSLAAAAGRTADLRWQVGLLIVPGDSSPTVAVFSFSSSAVSAASASAPAVAAVASSSSTVT